MTHFQLFPTERNCITEYSFLFIMWTHLYFLQKEKFQFHVNYFTFISYSRQPLGEATAGQSFPSLPVFSSLLSRHSPTRPPNASKNLLLFDLPFFLLLATPSPASFLRYTQHLSPAHIQTLSASPPSLYIQTVGPGMLLEYIDLWSCPSRHSNRKKKKVLEFQLYGRFNQISLTYSSYSISRLFHRYLFSCSTVGTQQPAKKNAKRRVVVLNSRQVLQAIHTERPDMTSRTDGLLTG